MEQTVNLFTKGLQMDTNPMIQGSDTLTDALNATLVTMNGNEVILQNDMGNRRVDNAFLPPGYEPVGMKEYGGVIYVASYNPVTHRSQIGSFPSPERRITSIDNNGSGKEYNFSFEKDDTNNYLKSDVILQSIDENLILHAGDKFVIYSSDLSNTSSSTIKTKLSNYCNTDGRKIISPKNKLYTLSLGILNSLNEFVDITKDLLRWDNNGLIKSFPNDSDLFKFNCGYFIATGYTPQISQAINDDELVLERQAIIANTYSYKLCGPLYLKILLNRPVKFNYNIYGYKENSETAYIIFDCFITYNCPDGITDNNSITATDSIYKYTGLLESYNDHSHKFCDIKKDNTLITYESGSGNSVKTISVVYDLKTNLYTMNQRYTNKVTIGTNNIINYDLLVKSGLTNIYLQDLSTTVSVDLNLLGTGAVNMKGWRFYNNAKKLNTVLTYTFEAYPKYELKFTNLLLLFYEYDGTNFSTDPTVILDNLDLNNGRNTISFDWEEKGFKSRKLYKVGCKYNIIDNDGNKIPTNPGTDPLNYDYSLNSKTEYFLTTELLNKYYSPSSSEFLYDFFKDKLNIPVNIGINSSLKDNSPKEEVDYIGELSGTSQILTYDCKHTKTLSILDSSKYEIINEELYPDFIELQAGIYPKISNAFIKKIGNTVLDTNDDLDIIFNTYIKPLIITNGNVGNYDLSDYNFSNFNILNSEKYITGTIEYYDRFISSGKNVDSIKNGFCPVSRVADKIFKVPNSDSTGGCGLSVDYHAQSGHGDDHFLNLFSGVSANTPNGLLYYRHDAPNNGGHHNGQTPNNAITIDSLHGDSQRIFYLPTYITKASNAFTHSLPSNLTITYMFGDDAECYTNELSVSTHSSELRTKTAARVWFRTRNDGWALFSDLFNPNGTANVYTEVTYSLQNNSDYITLETSGDNIIITINFGSFTDYKLKGASGVNIWYRVKHSSTGSYYYHSFSNSNFHLNYTIGNYTKLLITMENFPKDNNGQFLDFKIEIEKSRILFKKDDDKKINNLSSGKLLINTITRLGYGISMSNMDFKFSELSETISNLTIQEFVLNHLEHDYVYCAYDLYLYNSSNPRLYTSDLLNSTYNEKYSIPVTIAVLYSKQQSSISQAPVLDLNPHEFVYSSSLIEDLNPRELAQNPTNEPVNTNPIAVDPVDDPIDDSVDDNTENNAGSRLRGLRSSPSYIVKNFDDNKISFTEAEINGNNIFSAIQIILSSGNEFYNRIYKDILLEGVDVSTGKQYDFNLNILDPNYLYYYNENGDLIKQDSSYLKIDKQNKVDSINLLVYDREALGIPRFRYNATGWQNGDTSDASTLLDFSGVNIINTI